MNRPLTAPEMAELSVCLPPNLTAAQLRKLLNGVERVAGHAFREGQDVGALEVGMFDRCQHTETQQEDES